jgi:hypothetical protein
LATCIRRVANTARLPRTALPDYGSFDPGVIDDSMSGKYTALVRKLHELDALDMRDYGTKFKHFIFTDLRDSAFGAKAIAAFLIHGGYDFAMVEQAGRPVLDMSGSVVDGSNRFAILQSQPLWRQPMTVRLKRSVLQTYNARPTNIHGEQLRMIVLDSKYKEGIDLFDVKYVHLMEDAIASSDLKQAVGRATRYCGQRGLPFVPGLGWTLNVFIYSTDVPGVAPFTTTEQKISAHDLMMKHSGLDLSLLTLTANLQQLAIYSAVDRPLTTELHAGEYLPGTAEFMAEFGRWSWPAPKLESACAATGTSLTFTPTQNFLQTYFVPSRGVKGVLAWHSVGTGKTCSAIAVASGAFLAAGYRILWVTRNSLMNDVWKNVYDSVCYIPFRPVFAPANSNENPQPYRSMSVRGGALGAVSSLFLPPISYKMFQNALEKKNELGRALYRRHPQDMLYKTFLVIDEVHKLHDGDLLASEMADFSVIQSFIWKSYQVSGSASVRPLLMSATPIGDTPATLFDILNTLIMNKSQRLMPFSDFRRTFADKSGHISADGSAYFVERSRGLISYLNREYDPSTFAIPQFRTIHVPLGDIDTPTAKDVARECLRAVRVGPRKHTEKQTLKQRRLACYRKTRKHFTEMYDKTQRTQMLKCFHTKAKVPAFPTYGNYTTAFGEEDPELASVGSLRSGESAGTARAVWHFGTANRSYTNGGL